MPISKGYTLKLYCDNSEFGRQENTCKAPPLENVAEFTGELYMECANKALSNGWSIQREKGQAFCPYCNGKENKAA